MSGNYIEELTEKLSPLTSQIIHHPLYSEISSLEDLRTFMEQHVFAVWDFMCLLKELHRRIVATSAPWFPPKDPLSANLISSILVEEEGDITEDGKNYASHYETYVAAMRKIGADTTSIQKLLYLLANGKSITEAIDMTKLIPATKNFVLTTFSFFECGVHELAAAFVYGREGITSVMFSPLVEQIRTKIKQDDQHQLNTLIYYCKRHIELDNSEHFPKALQMLANLIGNDDQKWEEAEMAAAKALKARVEFLTGIQNILPNSLQLVLP